MSDFLIAMDFVAVFGEHAHRILRWRALVDVRQLREAGVSERGVATDCRNYPRAEG